MDLKERDVLKQVLDYLAVRHIFAFRLNTGRFFDNGRHFQAHSLGPGAADIVVPPPGTIWIEVKSSSGQQRPMQKLFQQMVEDRGDRYVIARSIDDLFRQGLK